MDIDGPTEVATIRDEVTAQWGGGIDLKTYTIQSKFLKGTGQRPPGLVPDSYESDDSDTDKRLSNRRTSTAAKHSTKESEDSTSENDGSGSEADNRLGDPGGPIEAADPEGKGPASEAAKAAKTGPKKGRKRRNRRGKKKSVPLIERSDEEEDNADVAMVVRVPQLSLSYLPPADSSRRLASSIDQMAVMKKKDRPPGGSTRGARTLTATRRYVYYVSILFPTF
jgi:hypothetical protein